MEVAARTSPEIKELAGRARAARSDEDRAACLRDIAISLETSSCPLQRAELIMCRARVHSNQWQTRRVLEDALAAAPLFEEAGEMGRALDATSLAAAFAARLGELSLAAELSTKAILGLDSVIEDCLVAEITNRLAIFCYSFLDYDRAAQQMETSLAAAERAGDGYKIHRQLHNIADVLLLAVRASRASDTTATLRPEDKARLERASQVVQRLEEEAPLEVRLGLGPQRVRAEFLLETGHPAEGLEVLNRAALGTGVIQDAQRSAFAVVESRCLRALGRGQEAVAAAERAVRLAQTSGDDLELMITLEERLAAKRAAGDLDGALGDALEVKQRMWAIHQRQTSQVVGEVWARAALQRERSQLQEKTAAAVRFAEEDALTGIGNRRLLEQFLANASETPTTLALVIVDIDHFKDVNDTFGHELGDLVMRAMGELFAAEARPGQVVVRYGGDEFVFAIPGAALATASSLAERVRLRVASHPWEELDTRLSVTVSLGVSSGKSDAWRTVFAAADGALYLAKRHGRNRVEQAASALENAV
jgi:diguanylate cyclase (GGDEF)-like protein